MSGMSNHRVCSDCKKSKDLTRAHFKPTRDGFQKTCIVCLQAKQLRRKKRAAEASKENLPAGGSADCDEDLDDDADKIDFGNLSELQPDAFLDAISVPDVTEFAARVNTSILSNVGSTLRDKADQLAKQVWERLRYRFMYVAFHKMIINTSYNFQTFNNYRYHSVYNHKRSPSSRFMYHCAQVSARQHKPKKGQREGAAERDKDQMDTFECAGWLHITLSEIDNTALVRLKHKDEHIPYWCIDVPPDVQNFIRANSKLSPTKVCSN
jgi:hypothetical protein